MNSSETTLQQAGHSPHATREDFRRFFLDHMSALYVLSLLLTGDHSPAEQCFMAALEECNRAPRVPFDKIESRAKRAITQHAIRLLKLHFGRVGRTNDAKSSGRGHDLSVFQMEWLLELPAFDRVVFVMSVLENNSDATCSFLLCCSLQEVRDARYRALTVLRRSGERASPVALARTVPSEFLR